MRGRSRRGAAHGAAPRVVAATAGAVGWAVVAGLAATPTGAQELADFDYENLAFRGVGVDFGVVFPNRVEQTGVFGARMDLGYLGPGLRLLPHVTWWSSRMEASEVAELEQRVEQLVDEQSPPGTPPAAVDLGVIDWSDLVLGVDGQVVWRIPYGVLTYVGTGLALHLVNGDGDAIRDTFVEDLLDRATAGFNLHAGVEYPVAEGFRVYGTAKWEVLEDLNYFDFRVGLQFMFGAPAPGEVRSP